MNNCSPYKTLPLEHRKSILINLYENQKLSIAKISSALDVSGTQIIRDMKKMNINRRTKSEAQKLALDIGESKHPTAGKRRDEKTKEKISISKSRSFAETSEERKKEIADKIRDKFLAQPEEKRKQIQYSGQLAIREASKHGSKIEIFIRDRLINDGFVVEHHREHLIKNEKLHIDLLLPKINIAIEVDGPSHYAPVWGEESLNKVQRADNEKNALLVSQGLHCIRLRTKRGTISEIYKNKLYEKLKKTIDDLITEKQAKVVQIYE